VEPKAGEASQLTGIGATETTFNENHTEQSVAKRTGSVRGVDSVVNDGHGKVRVYVVEFNAHPPPSLDTAEQEVAQLELPKDSSLTATHRTSSCVQQIYSSPALHRALGVSTVLVEFQSASEQGGTLDPSAVTSATITSVTGAEHVPC
jgi:hypothetical protein